MKSYTADELKTVVDGHKKWLINSAKGTRANLSGANLSGTDLSGANLSGANLSGTDLSGANLRCTNLSGADLSGANLSGTDLSDANLSDAYLSSADLSGANLYGVNLSGANLHSANLRCTNLRSTDLRSANLRCTNLSGANLSGANLPPLLVPEEGSFIVWKKLAYGLIAKLQITEDSKRTSSLVGRKCRAQSAKVLAITNEKGEPVVTGHSSYDNAFTYTVGEIVTAPDYDEDIRIECTKGIHFFMTRKEAEEY